MRSGLEVSHPLAGLLLPIPCGFISPRSHPWGSTLQGFPLPRSCVHLVGGTVPSWRLFPLYPPFMRRRPRATPTCAASIRTGSFHRLQGLALPGSPFIAVNCLGKPRAGPLLGLRLPRAFPPSMDRTDFAAPPLTRLNRLGFQSFPLAPEPACATEFRSTDGVALPLTRPPCPFEVSRLRTTRHFGKCPVRAFCSPRASGGVATP